MFYIRCKNDLKFFRITEFHHHLSAHSARRCIFCQNSVFSSYDTDCIEFLHAFTYCLEKCCSLCTVCRCVLPIFNMTAGINRSIFCQQCCPNLEAGVRCIRIFQLFYRRLNQLTCMICFAVFCLPHLVSPLLYSYSISGNQYYT